MSRNSIAFANWGNERCRRLVAPVSSSSPRCFFPTASVLFLKELFLPFGSLLKPSLFVFVLYLRFALFSLPSSAFLSGLYENIPLVHPTFFLNSSAPFFFFRPLLFSFYLSFSLPCPRLAPCSFCLWLLCAFLSFFNRSVRDEDL